MSPAHLGDRVFLVMHDPFNGLPEVSRELINCGLLAADIGQMIVAGRLGCVQHGIVAESDHEAGGGDLIEDHILGHIVEERSAQDLPTWIELLGDAVFELHVRKLVEQAIIRRERHRSVMRRARERFPAIDLLAAGGPLLRLRHMLRNPRELDLDGALLACVVNAVGGDRILELDAHDNICEEILQELPTELRMLMSDLTDAVTSVGFASR